MTENTSFSIIIPTYNRADLIKITLDSVLAQNYPSCEIIVVDNCSTDNTAEVLQPLVDAGEIRFIRHEQNLGRSQSRNTGFENATGEWLLFLDSDDLMAEGALSFLASKISVYPQAGIIGGGYLKIDENGKQINCAIREGLIEGMVNAPYLSLISNYYLPMGSYIVHRDVVNAGGEFESDLEPCEDLDFCLRMARKGKLAYFKTPVAKFRQHGGNTAADLFYVTAIKVAHKHINETINDASVKNKNLIISEWKNFIANNFFYQSKFKNAFYNYAAAAFYNPKKTFNPFFLKQIFSCLTPVWLKNRLKASLLSNHL
jgi:glycosyltransferase involved in cell wall biosynthesis